MATSIDVPEIPNKRYKSRFKLPVAKNKQKET